MDQTAAALIPEIVQDDYPQFFLEAIANKKIEKSEVKPILEEFQVSVTLFGISEKTRAIVVTEESQTDLMAEARELRLKLKAERVRISKAKKEIKEPYLRKTQVIDGIHLIIERMFEAEEDYLQQQEDFAKVQELNRIATLSFQRSEMLLQYNHIDLIPGLGSIPEANFQLLLAGAKAKFDEHVAELARKEQEDKDRIAREAELKAENDRLRLEKEEADRKAESERVERERIETAARLEREAAEQKERDRVAAEEAEKKRVAAAEETERQRLAAVVRAKELAPDRDKLLAYAQEISKLRDDAPTMSTDETRVRLDSFRVRLVELQNEIEGYANSLTANAETIVPF